MRQNFAFFFSRFVTTCKKTSLTHNAEHRRTLSGAAVLKYRCLNHFTSGKRLNFDIKQRQRLILLQVFCQPR